MNNVRVTRSGEILFNDDYDEDNEINGITTTTTTNQNVISV